MENLKFHLISHKILGKVTKFQKALAKALRVITKELGGGVPKDRIGLRTGLLVTITVLHELFSSQVMEEDVQVLVPIQCEPKQLAVDISKFHDTSQTVFMFHRGNTELNPLVNSYLAILPLSQV